MKQWGPTIHTRIELNDSNFEVVYLFLTHGYSPSNYKMRNTQNITFNTFAAQIYSKIDEEGEPNFIFKETINHCKAKMHLIRLINMLNLVGSILRKRNNSFSLLKLFSNLYQSVALFCAHFQSLSIFTNLYQFQIDKSLAKIPQDTLTHFSLSAP